jgi:hypothetical protein
MTIEAFPLSWPDGWPRAQRRHRAPYTVSGDRARRELLVELRLLGAAGVIVSSNVPLRQDGQPYADAARRRIDDPGIAVYFTRTARDAVARHQQVIACDKWDSPDSNIRAIGLAVAGLRAVARSGASELLDRAFTGFRALPPAGGTSVAVDANGPPWWQVLGVARTAPRGVVQAAYRTLARKHHPDVGGDAGAMAALNRAWEQAQSAIGAP